MSQLPLQDIRQEYRMASLSEKDVAKDPFSQFEKWFHEVLHAELEMPNAMTLATVSAAGQPSARIVLLKGVDPEGFYFYTNYESKKSFQLEANPRAALVFFWKELERQVRVEGTVHKADTAASDAYFETRPRMSRIGSWASPQSRTIPDRAFLDRQMAEAESRFRDIDVHRPPFWGGYIVRPELVEFWQGRSNRLHDRLQYTRRSEGEWLMERLAP